MIRKLWLLCNMYVGRVPNVDEIREKSGKFCLEEKAEKESTFMKKSRK